MSDYEILGISEDSSKDDVTKAFRRLAMKLHPDRNNSPEAGKQFISIKTAYDRIISGVGKKSNKRTFDSEKAKREEAVYDIFYKSIKLQYEKNHASNLIRHILSMNSFYGKETVIYEAFITLNKENKFLRDDELIRVCNDAYETFANNKMFRRFVDKVAKLPSIIKVFGLLFITSWVVNLLYLLTHFKH